MTDHPHQSGTPSGPLLVYTRNCEPKRPSDAQNAVFSAPSEPPSDAQNGDPQAPSKWQLQTVARSILPENRRLQKCYRTPLAGGVEVHRSPSRQTAAYRNLCTCSSVWACPVCAARLGVFRALEVTAALDRHLSQGGDAVMLTFTASHTRDDELPHLLAAHKAAHARFFRTGSVRAALADVGTLGRITAQEVTFSNGAGFHPHKHVLLLLDGSHPAPLQALEALASTWRNVAARSGLTASRDHGLRASGGRSAGAYVAKLGLEVSLSVCKKGRNGSHGPWQLLRAASDGESFALVAFRTYALALKGTAHLRWSPGLKAALLVDEVTDAEVMASGGEQDEALAAVLSRRLWSGICRADVRSDVLALVGADDFDTLTAMMLVYGLDAAGLTRV